MKTTKILLPVLFLILITTVALGQITKDSISTTLVKPTLIGPDTSVPDNILQKCLVAHMLKEVTINGEKIKINPEDLTLFLAKNEVYDMDNIKKATVDGQTNEFLKTSLEEFIKNNSMDGTSWHNYPNKEAFEADKKTIIVDGKEHIVSASAYLTFLQENAIISITVGDETYKIVGQMTFLEFIEPIKMQSETTGEITTKDGLVYEVAQPYYDDCIKQAMDELRAQQTNAVENPTTATYSINSDGDALVSLTNLSSLQSNDQITFGNDTLCTVDGCFDVAGTYLSNEFVVPATEFEIFNNVVLTRYLTTQDDTVSVFFIQNNYPTGEPITEVVTVDGESFSVVGMTNEDVVVGVSTNSFPSGQVFTYEAASGEIWLEPALTRDQVQGLVLLLDPTKPIVDQPVFFSYWSPDGELLAQSEGEIYSIENQVRTDKPIFGSENQPYATIRTSDFYELPSKDEFYNKPHLVNFRINGIKVNVPVLQGLVYDETKVVVPGDTTSDDLGKLPDYIKNIITGASDLTEDDGTVVVSITPNEDNETDVTVSSTDGTPITRTPVRTSYNPKNGTTSIDGDTSISLGIAFQKKVLNDTLGHSLPSTDKVLGSSIGPDGTIRAITKSTDTTRFLAYKNGELREQVTNPNGDTIGFTTLEVPTNQLESGFYKIGPNKFELVGLVGSGVKDDSGTVGLGKEVTKTDLEEETKEPEIFGLLDNPLLPVGILVAGVVLLGLLLSGLGLLPPIFGKKKKKKEPTTDNLASFASESQTSDPSQNEI